MERCERPRVGAGILGYREEMSPQSIVSSRLRTVIINLSSLIDQFIGGRQVVLVVIPRITAVLSLPV